MKTHWYRGAEAAESEKDAIGCQQRRRLPGHYRELKHESNQSIKDTKVRNK